MALWLWGAIACGAIALAALVLASRIRVRVRYSRSGRLDQLVIIVQALRGLVSIQTVMPSIFIRGMSIVYNEHTKSGAIPGRPAKEQADKRRFGIRSLRRYRRAYREVRGSTRRFREWFRETMRRIECSRLRMDLRLGTGDAAETAVLAGLAWTAYGCITGLLSEWLRLKTPPHGEVKPVYGRAEFELVVEADFRLRVATAAASLLRLIGRTPRLRRAIRAWRELARKPGVA